MKVIKSQNIADWKTEKSCNNCDTLLEITIDDLTYHSAAYYFRGEFSPGYYTAQCIVCNGLFTFPENELPKAARYRTTTVSGK